MFVLRERCLFMNKYVPLLINCLLLEKKKKSEMGYMGILKERWRITQIK